MLLKTKDIVSPCLPTEALAQGGLKGRAEKDFYKREMGNSWYFGV
jgi:hypothetical protein